ncbi:MAG: hypothetical protein H6R18_2018 [Proteobacteria bacterium]|nr:hypothetical protein [Pseudomonadota bacterium]
MAVRALTLLSWLAYPLLIYFGLQLFEPRTLGALLALVFILRQRKAAAKLFRGTATGEKLLFFGLLMLSATIIVSNSELLLRAYPAIMSFSMLALFATTLFRPPSMIERFARLSRPDLPPDRIHYTRRVTQIWCAFFVINGVIAITTIFASREIWALWNGLLSYIAMGTLFIGERIFRHYIDRQKPAAVSESQ